MLWIKALHIIFMVTWFAGLFYLPRLFVYHAMSTDLQTIATLKTMERKLFWGIMTPCAIFTLSFGLWLLYSYAWQIYKSFGWLHIKLGLSASLVLYHIYCGYCLKQFQLDKNTHSHTFYRWFNEYPLIVLTIVTIMVVVKPY
jgi:putative membrane protein